MECIWVWVIYKNSNGANNPSTTRKLCQKQPQPKLAAIILTNLICNHYTTHIFFFFGLVTKILGIVGRVIYNWRGLENIFPTVYYTPKKLKNYSKKNEKKKFVVI